MSPPKRDRAALEALASLPPRSSRAKRLATSGLTWGQWRCSLRRLVAAGLVEPEEGDRVSGEPDALIVTTAGHETLCRPAHPSTGSSTPPSTPLDDDSSSVLIHESEQDPSSSSVSTRVLDQDEPAHPPARVAQHTPLLIEALRSLSFERLNITVTHALDPASLAALADALAHRDVNPHNVLPGNAPTAPAPSRDPSPSNALCDCGKPLSSPRRKKDGSGWGRGCVDYGPESGCRAWVPCDREGNPLAEAPTVVPNLPSSEAQDSARKARDEHRAQVLAEREAARAAEDKVHAERIAALADARRAERIKPTNGVVTA